MATSTISAGKRPKTSSILLKTVMAVTGLIFVGFILAHMYGNLMIFAGTDSFNEYAHHLREFGTPMLPEKGFLWVMRIVLLASVVLHAASAFMLWGRAGQARTTRYVARKGEWATFVKRSMRWGGVALLIFVVFHILHFTTNTIQIGGDFDNPADRLVASFGEWWAVLLYLLAVAALGMHLLHGIWSAGMTLGLNTSLDMAERLRLVAILVAVVVVVGFALPPVAILLGLIP
ncbi:succinate dehydrogenase cytochrome b subunit [Ornithinimicrobium faecis]|uniref:Succinate dehydrogenase cytochrome b subunit n=1 Tax=Ornithinimicrobium faecis TaxID=2934158 RepID=A0ABY4YRT2_9MICO|nr:MULTISPECIES: succinate dehydrogenase cytochrome b subunit [unclassified Ornithinimicrobium]USQ79479.1 succinate dehydrogenase cytochrome b subunit [Ornithinimicrobium sp. HY1793]